MDIEEIKKLAEQKADQQERRGTSVWIGLYYGFIYGYQACEKENNISQNNDNTVCDHPKDKIQIDNHGHGYCGKCFKYL